LRTFTPGAALSPAFDLALPSGPHLVFRARFAFEFFQCLVAAHAFPNRGDGDVAQSENAQAENDCKKECHVLKFNHLQKLRQELRRCLCESSASLLSATQVDQKRRNENRERRLKRV
jgi:hypothetical protein